MPNKQYSEFSSREMMVKFHTPQNVDIVIRLTKHNVEMARIVERFNFQLFDVKSLTIYVDELLVKSSFDKNQGTERIYTQGQDSMTIPEISRLYFEGKQMYELVSIFRDPSNFFPVRIEYAPAGREL